MSPVVRDMWKLITPCALSENGEMTVMASFTFIQAGTLPVGHATHMQWGSLFGSALQTTQIWVSRDSKFSPIDSEDKPYWWFLQTLLGYSLDPDTPGGKATAQVLSCHW